MKYHKTNQKEIAKFFKKKKDSDDESEEKEEEQEKRTERKEHELPKSDVFAIVEPLSTVVGEIGKFILTPETFPIHPAIVAFGKRRTGKTFTLRWWLYNGFRDIPFGCVFTNTSINGFWQVKLFNVVQSCTEVEGRTHKRVFCCTRFLCGYCEQTIPRPSD